MYVIPEEHANRLRGAFGLRQDPDVELPEGVEDAYWADVKLAKRMGVFYDEKLLFLLAKQFPVPDDKPKDFLAFAGDASHGDPVEVRWQRGMWKPARYLGLTGDRKQVIIQFDGDPEERQLDPKRVRLPELVTA